MRLRRCAAEDREEHGGEEKAAAQRARISIGSIASQHAPYFCDCNSGITGRSAGGAERSADRMVDGFSSVFLFFFCFFFLLGGFLLRALVLDGDDLTVNGVDVDLGDAALRGLNVE